MPRWPKQKPRPGVDEYGRAPIWYCALEGDLDGIRRELAAGAEPSRGDDVGYTPLHAAVQSGHVEAIRVLLDHGADPNAADSHGNGALWTCVMQAPEDRSQDIADLLLAAGADPDRPNEHGRSPQDLATTLGKQDLEQRFAHARDRRGAGR